MAEEIQNKRESMERYIKHEGELRDRYGEGKVSDRFAKGKVEGHKAGWRHEKGKIKG